MDQSTRIVQPTDDRSMVLKKLKTEQQKYYEGSFEWADLQSKIDQIIAENYLSYLNR